MRNRCAVRLELQFFVSSRLTDVNRLYYRLKLLLVDLLQFCWIGVLLIKLIRLLAETLFARVLVYVVCVEVLLFTFVVNRVLLNDLFWLIFY